MTLISGAKLGPYEIFEAVARRVPAPKPMTRAITACPTQIL